MSGDPSTAGGVSDRRVAGRQLTRRQIFRSVGLTGLALAVGPIVAGGCHRGNRDSRLGSADPAWEAVIAGTEDRPVITASLASHIVDGTLITPTGSFDGDPHLRYDGCTAISSDSSGVYAELPEMVVPETVTDARQIEGVFRSGRQGRAVVGLRAVVNGKLSHLRLLRFDAEQNKNYYFNLQFPSRKLRHVKIEIDGVNRFVGLIVDRNSACARPEGKHRFRYTAIGDSIQRGGPDYRIGAEEPGDFFYMCWESHSRFHAALMGCDSYVNLGVGGSGWTSALPEDPYSARLPLALRGSPHVLGLFGSRNDWGHEAELTSAVRTSLLEIENVPVVLVSGPQQAGYSHLNELVREGTWAVGRTWLDLQGIAASPDSNPTRHPTFDEQLNLALAAQAQLDMDAVMASVRGGTPPR